MARRRCFALPWLRCGVRRSRGSLAPAPGHPRAMCKRHLHNLPVPMQMRLQSFRIRPLVRMQDSKPRCPRRPLHHPRRRSLSALRPKQRDRPQGMPRRLPTLLCHRHTPRHRKGRQPLRTKKTRSHAASPHGPRKSGSTSTPSVTHPASAFRNPGASPCGKPTISTWTSSVPAMARIFTNIRDDTNRRASPGRNRADRNWMSPAGSGWISWVTSHLRTSPSATSKMPWI